MDENDRKHTSNLLISLLGPIFVILAFVVDFGGNRNAVSTLQKEVEIIRAELRERTKDRIYRYQHDQDIQQIERRIERNETWIYGADDGGTNGKPHIHKNVD